MKEIIFKMFKNELFFEVLKKYNEYNKAIQVKKKKPGRGPKKEIFPVLSISLYPYQIKSVQYTDVLN